MQGPEADIRRWSRAGVESSKSDVSLTSKNAASPERQNRVTERWQRKGDCVNR